MPVEVGLWRIEGTEPVRLSSQGMPFENHLERLIESDPSLLGEQLLLVGRQVPTSHGGFIDLLAIDSDGNLHVLELKRDRTPRDVVAQALDYGSWVATLSHEQILAIYGNYRTDQAFEEAFSERFNDNPPEELNTDQQLTIVAGTIDAATERIVTYLNGRFDVPINVLFFQYYADDGREYLARTWLVTESTDTVATARANRTRSKEAWNGLDWYISFGEDDTNVRNWDDARYYGFVSAGGGQWYSRTLQRLPEGARVFVHIPKTGYVGVGTVTGPAVPASEATVTVDGEQRQLTDCPLTGTYRPSRTGRDTTEYVVPVNWIATKPREEAIWQRGMFANQNSACPLRNRFTLDQLTHEFNLGDDETATPSAP